MFKDMCDLLTQHFPGSQSRLTDCGGVLVLARHQRNEVYWVFIYFFKLTAQHLQQGNGENKIKTI